MKRLNEYIKNNRGFILIYIPASFAVFLLLFMLLRFSEKAAKGVGEGLKLSFEVLFPTLFPFTVGSTFLVYSGVLLKKTKLSERLSRHLFRLSFPATTVFLLSFLGGYPVGGKLISDLYKKGAISRQEGRRMFLFCINPSLSFVLSFLGSGLLKSTQGGTIVLISIFLTSFFVGFFSGVFGKEKGSDDYHFAEQDDLSVVSAFGESVKQGAVTMGYICAYVVFFSAVGELITVLPFSERTILFLRCIPEVTNGVRCASNSFSLPFVTFIVSFGGISTLFQIMGFIEDLSLNKRTYITARLFSASLSSLLTYLLLILFPACTETFSSGSISEIPVTSYSAPVTAGLMLMTALLILGDGFVVSKKDLDINRGGR